MRTCSVSYRHTVAIDMKKSSIELTLLGCLFLSVLCRMTVNAGPPVCAGLVKVSNRVSCGEGGISKKECEDKGCCFDSSVPEVPWCFYQPWQCQDKISVDQRVSCGWNGITAEECGERDCCFDYSVPNVPWCFFKEQEPPVCAGLVEVSDRVNCGYSGISKKECEDKGCCFDFSVPDVPWCFYQPWQCKDKISVDQRVSCGWSGITAEECGERDCCFDDSVPDVPWCFFKDQEPPECAGLLEVSDRVNCGYSGISKKECEDRGCCFDFSVPEVPWCFYQPGICELPSGLKNVAVGKKADQSSINKGAAPDRAVDGDKNSDLKKGQSCMWTRKEFEPWWKVDLGQEYSIYEVVITNRQDCCPSRIKNAVVRIGDDDTIENNPVCGEEIVGKISRQETITVRCGCETPMRGRYVSIKLADETQQLHVCEVEVMAL